MGHYSEDVMGVKISPHWAFLIVVVKANFSHRSVLLQFTLF